MNDEYKSGDTGNVIDITSRSSHKRRDEDASPPVPIEKMSRDDRLKQVDASLCDKIKAAHKLEHKDREQLARNLGLMFRDITSRGSVTENALFREILGDEDGRSQQSNRKRLVLYAGEKYRSGYAHGAKYLELAEGLASYLEADNAQRRRLAILRLIGGTGFDDLRTDSDRQEAECASELQAVVEKIIQPVINSGTVNLNWMESWVTRHPVRGIGKPGRCDDLDLTDFQGDYSSLKTSHPIYDCLPPCVRIATVHSPYSVPGVKVPLQPSDIDEHGKYTAIVNAALPIVGASYSKSDAGDCHWKDYFPGARDEPVRQKIYIKRYIDLELRYDQDLGKWKLCVIVRFPSSNAYGGGVDFIGDGEQQINHFSSKRGSKFEPGFVLPPEFCCQDASWGNVVFAVELGANEVFLFREFLDFATLYGDHDIENGPWPTFLGIDEDGYQFPEQSCIELLMARLAQFDGDVEFHTSEFKDGEETLFTPAPIDTIAHQILCNMRYAPTGQKISDLLVRDATEKYEKLRSLANKLECEYKRD